MQEVVGYLRHFYIKTESHRSQGNEVGLACGTDGDVGENHIEFNSKFVWI